MSPSVNYSRQETLLGEILFDNYSKNLIKTQIQLHYSPQSCFLSAKKKTDFCTNPAYVTLNRRISPPETSFVQRLPLPCEQSRAGALAHCHARGTPVLNNNPFSAVLNPLIPSPLAFSFCSSSLWDLERWTGAHPSDLFSSAAAGRCSGCRQQPRRCPAWSRHRGLRAVGETLGKRRFLPFPTPELLCTPGWAPSSRTRPASPGWPTQGAAAVTPRCDPGRLSPSGFCSGSLCGSRGSW